MMGPGPVRIAGGAGGNRRDGAFAVPAAGSRGRAGVFVLAAAAALALASGAVTGMPAAHAAAAVTARTAAAVQAHPRVVEPCPCDNPVCRPVCHQSMASGGPAALIHRQTPRAAAQAVVTITATAVNCPPPSRPATASSDGQPSC
jgi:hypothetical protein